MTTELQIEATVSAPSGQSWMQRLGRHTWLLMLALAVVTLVLYSPVRHQDFSNLDDSGYASENLHIRTGWNAEFVRWAFTTYDCENWHPITWFSHSLDYSLFGLDPAGHHETNVILHALDAVLLFWVLKRATGYTWRSYMVAALFALHPINVESVAWVAERKTMLSMLFFLLTLAAYQWYARKPQVGRYVVMAVLFSLGLMSKPQIIMLPAVLVLWDFWPLRRLFPNAGECPADAVAPAAYPPRTLKQLLWEKVPLGAICLASALVTLLAQKVGRPRHWPFPLSVRLENAIVCYARYIGKMVWPSSLAVLYPHPGNAIRLWQVAVSLLILLAISAWVALRWRYRYLVVGWLWFLIMLVPVIGILQVGRQAMADRYAYQSFLGLFIMVGWGISDWAQRYRPSRVLLPAASLLVVLAMIGGTYHQLGYWRDSLIMWKHATEVTENNWVAEDMIAGLLSAHGHKDEALAHYRLAAGWDPNDPVSNLFLAVYEQQQGNLQLALQHYRSALKLTPTDADKANIYQNMGVAYRELGDTATAHECFQQALKLRVP